MMNEDELIHDLEMHKILEELKEGIRLRGPQKIREDGEFLDEQAQWNERLIGNDISDMFKKS